MRQDCVRLLNALKEGVYIVDGERRILFWNRGAEQITGFRKEEVEGTLCKDNVLNHVNSEGTNLCRGDCPLAVALREGAPKEASLFLLHREGHRVPVSISVIPLEDDEGHVTGAAEVFWEASPEEGLRMRLDELEKLALLDPLTKMPNRRCLETEMDVQFQNWERNGTSFGLLFFDMDNFKRFNDTYGHDVGDVILQAVARTLFSSTRPFDTLGRWGGEEFVGIFPNTGLEVLENVAARLCMLVRNTRVRVGDESLCLTVSVGGTVPKPGDTPGRMLRRADGMMYRSKREGRDRVSVG